jgi:DNA-binding transcriptional ArsR family regulator
MADAGQGPQGNDKPKRRRRKSAKKEGENKRESRAKPGNTRNGRRVAKLIWSIAHPVRRRILRAIADRGKARSPTQIAEQLDLPVNMVAYHAGVLRKLEAVELAGEGQVQGAIEHFYDSAIEDAETIEALLEETREADEEDA